MQKLLSLVMYVCTGIVQHALFRPIDEETVYGVSLRQATRYTHTALILVREGDQE